MQAHFDLGAAADGFGPVLFLRGAHEDGIALVAIVGRRDGVDPGPLTTDLGETAPQAISSRLGLTIHRYAFTLPKAATARYTLGGETHHVVTDFSGELRLAFASCNGQEDGDLDRDMRVRNAMWDRLGTDHSEEPLQLLMHGGDQVYADEVTDAHPATEGWPEEVPEVDAAEAPAIREALADAFFHRYALLYAQPEFARIAAQVPSLTVWDDHDICDGWGSLAEWMLDSTQGRAIFAEARNAYLTFQFGAAPESVPRICGDASGRSLGWHVTLPGIDIIAPDLRSERRPDRAMDEAGWRQFSTAMEAATQQRVIVISSVPALGPRLSLIEKYMNWTPWVEKYEDDLRDQWQSRAHREEWRAFLRTLLSTQDRGKDVTVISGEIHLATRGTMKGKDGPIHQLVASGIAHPAPPRTYTTCLGGLARLGEAPLPEHPIRMHPLPGRRAIYTPQRNYLLLERHSDVWHAAWQLEESGLTPWLDI